MAVPRDVPRSPAALIALRVTTGFALAWVYPPGMKVAAGWFDKQRGAALGMVIGALTIGSAFPHLMAAASTRIPWRTLMLSASALAVIGGLIVVAKVGDGPYVAKSARFDPRAITRVFSHRPARLATLGYLGHMWELYAVWTWIAAFATASLATADFGAAPVSSQTGSAIAFLTIASGARWAFLCLVPGPLLGALALRGLSGPGAPLARMPEARRSG